MSISNDRLVRLQKFVEHHTRLQSVNFEKLICRLAGNIDGLLNDFFSFRIMIIDSLLPITHHAGSKEGLR